MGHFVPPHDKLTATLVGERSGRELWRLERPLVFLSDLIGLIQVPPLFVSDGASVPRLPLMYWLFGGRATRVSVVHDWLYEEQRVGGMEITRAQADAVWNEASDADGQPLRVSRSMWTGIRAGGWIHWGAHRKGRAPRGKA